MHAVETRGLVSSDSGWKVSSETLISSHGEWEPRLRRGTGKPPPHRGFIFEIIWHKIKGWGENSQTLGKGAWHITLWVPPLSVVFSLGFNGSCSYNERCSGGSRAGVRVRKNKALKLAPKS